MFSKDFLICVDTVNIEVTCVDTQGSGALHQLWEPFTRLPDKNSSGESHTALASCSEGCTHELVDGVLFVGIRHHHAMVLGTLKMKNVGHGSVGFLSS